MVTDHTLLYEYFSQFVTNSFLIVQILNIDSSTFINFLLLNFILCFCFLQFYNVIKLEVQYLSLLHKILLIKSNLVEIVILVNKKYSSMFIVHFYIFLYVTSRLSNSLFCENVIYSYSFILNLKLQSTLSLLRFSSICFSISYLFEFMTPIKFFL